MGWNTWNHFGCSISEDTILSAAKAFAKYNLTRHGYECERFPAEDHQPAHDPGAQISSWTTVGPASFSKHFIPAFLTWRSGWHAPARANGTNAPVADPEKFPNGVKDLADQIHGMGLKVHFLTNCRESDVHTSLG
jgi:alpha-galactosidase